MSDKNLLIIFSSQEFVSANHKDFWISIAEKSRESTDVVVIDILADSIITRIKGKKYRIKDHKLGLKQIKENLFTFRPMTFIRPEILPNQLHLYAMRQIKNQLENIIENYKNRKKIVLYYNWSWNKSLNILGENIKKIYFIYDEVIINAGTGKEIKGARIGDYLSCKSADLILTMTEPIAEKREEFKDKIIVLGNGSIYIKSEEENVNRIKQSIGFVGNFRDWIDLNLLRTLIEKKSDYFFCFAGPVESNVENQFKNIINNYTNTVYLGKMTKERISEIYKMIDIVIVPYKNNEHIRSTRPIKIVESIFNQTPVITIPMSGYKENQYIRFASNVTEFIEQIDFLESNKPDFNGVDFQKFITENSWGEKADIIIKEIDKFMNK